MKRRRKGGTEPQWRKLASMGAGNQLGALLAEAAKTGVDGASPADTLAVCARAFEPI